MPVLILLAIPTADEAADISAAISATDSTIPVRVTGELSVEQCSTIIEGFEAMSPPAKAP